jgi:hypothetical protein
VLRKLAAVSEGLETSEATNYLVAINGRHMNAVMLAI